MTQVRKSRPRKQLPFEAWPKEDQAAWEELFRKGNIIDGSGAASHWSEVTRRGNCKKYGRWLSWLEATGRLDDRAPWERASQNLVQAYARALLDEVKRDEIEPRTAASYLIGLKCVLQCMAPKKDWSWLNELTNSFDSWAEPSREPVAPELTLPEMFDRALAELERLSRIAKPRPRSLIAYRDTLLVALLIASPVRSRNIVMMQVDRHLVRLRDEWHLRFEPEETKTGQAVHLVVHPDLSRFVEEYLARIRPVFRGAAGHSQVWVALKAKPMAPFTLYNRVKLTTEQLFGTAIDPHSFRGLAATFLAESSPEDALHARALLGHRLPATTEQYYIRANQLRAAQMVSAALRNIRDNR